MERRRGLSYLIRQLYAVAEWNDLLRRRRLTRSSEASEPDRRTNGSEVIPLQPAAGHIVGFMPLWKNLRHCPAAPPPGHPDGFGLLELPDWLDFQVTTLPSICPGGLHRRSYSATWPLLVDYTDAHRGRATTMFGGLHVAGSWDLEEELGDVRY